ncbi:MAG: polyisoprenoid-binding protein, partial [Proteobacteria bacterium]|nr:polyisoprenoid-binding protein [Pseudomonadota bacterium]
MNLLTFLAFLLVLPCWASTWEIDDSHTAAKFKIKHLMVSNVYGQITGAKGTLDIDDKDPSKTSGTITLDVSTINTNNEKRDAHLKDADFFEVTKHPTISFSIKKLSKSKNGKYLMEGDLTIKGVTKPVVLKEVELTPTVKDPWGGTRRGLSGITTIDRKDFGLTWNKTLDGGGVVVGEKVDVEIAAELKAKSEN